MTRDFAREILVRLPLAEAVLWRWRWLVDQQCLHELFERQRGRGSEQISRFPVLGQVIAEAL
jgi:hypothetical protein